MNGSAAITFDYPVHPNRETLNTHQAPFSLNDHALRYLAAMRASPLATSLKLLIGRKVFDGAAPEALAEKYGVCVTDVNRAWLDCRERLSRHFAEREQFDYRLLDDNDLHARPVDALRLLLAWHDAAVYTERLEDSKHRRNEDNSKNGDEIAGNAARSE